MDLTAEQDLMVSCRKLWRKPWGTRAIWRRHEGGQVWRNRKWKEAENCQRSLEDHSKFAGLFVAKALRRAGGWSKDVRTYNAIQRRDRDDAQKSRAAMWFGVQGSLCRCCRCPLVSGECFESHDEIRFFCTAWKRHHCTPTYLFFEES